MNVLGRFIAYFVAWNQRPRQMSAEEVAAMLQKFVDDSASRSEWDYFCTGPPLADAKLEGIRLSAQELYGPRVEPYTSERLQELLAQTEVVASLGSKAD
jgi:hypothetical protein